MRLVTGPLSIPGEPIDSKRSSRSASSCDYQTRESWLSPLSGFSFIISITKLTPLEFRRQFV